MNTNKYNPGHLGQESPRTDGSVSSSVAISLGFIALVLVASNPLVALSVVAGAVVGIAVLWLGLVALARRTSTAIDELDVPGVGTVEIRIVGQ